MARCRGCGNVTNFNVWCMSKKVMEVELDINNNFVAIAGIPENESLRTEEISIADGDIEFAMVNCAWCGSEDIEFEKGAVEKYAREQ